MNDIAELKKQAKPLYAFVYKYFERLNPEDISDLKYEFVLTPVEVYQRAMDVYYRLVPLFKSSHEEDDVMALWAHQELVLQCLVVLNNLPLMSESIKQAGLLNASIELQNLLIDKLTDKAVEDPNVLYSIQSGTLDEEIEKRKEARELYNFKPLFEQEASLVVDVEGVDFQEIPENF